MKKKIVLGIALLAAVAVGVAIGKGTDAPPSADAKLQEVASHVYGMKSFMCEMGVKRALTSVEALGYQAIPQRSTVAHDSDPEDNVSLSEAELDAVAEYVTEQLIENGELPTGEDVVSATGVHVTQAHIPVIQAVVIDMLGNDPKGRELLAGSRCSDYGACSLHGNLSGASGEVLEMYEREIEEDGRRFENRQLPEFSAQDLADRTVSTSELKGQPTLLSFLAVHCNHSIDSLPILQEIHRLYGGEGLRVIAVFVNSGTPEDLNYWLPRFSPEYEIWSYNDADLGDLIGSHLVPTSLFIDAQGQVVEKLVGFKPQDAVTEWVSGQLSATREGEDQIAAS